MKEKPIKKNKGTLGGLPVSILLLLIAIVSITAATVAWFSIADNGRIQSMNLEVTAGTGMRFDISPHRAFEEYAETLKFSQIAEQIKEKKGFDMMTASLDPVTTQDCQVFRQEDGQVVDDTKGSYLSFTLNFMAKDNMVVHLTSDDKEDKVGTLITSPKSGLAKAMRISFTTGDGTYIYDPGIGNTSTGGTIKTFGLPPKEAMEYNDHNAMFRLQANVNKEVICHVWLEGEDPACTDRLKGADYKIALKFKGTDEANRPIGDDRYEEKQNNNIEEHPEYYTKRDDTADEQDEEDEGFLTMLKQFWNNIKDIFNKNN